MTDVDLATWPRRDHYRLYRGLDFPYFSVTVEVEVGPWRQALKAAGLPFFGAFVHQVTAAATAVEAFRLRIRGERVVRHDVLHPSFTVPWRDELFNFCTVDFDPDLATFLAACKPAVAAAEAAETLLADEPGRDDMSFLSCLPWLGFTGLTQAAHAAGGDSFPRFAWGRATMREGREVVPLNVQVHHALVDGLHVARFVERLEAGIAAHTASLER